MTLGAERKHGADSWRWVVRVRWVSSHAHTLPAYVFVLAIRLSNVVVFLWVGIREGVAVARPASGTCVASLSRRTTRSHDSRCGYRSGCCSPNKSGLFVSE